MDREKYDKFEHKMKPFADFSNPDLIHLNKSEVTDYLKKPLRTVKFEKKPKELV